MGEPIFVEGVPARVTKQDFLRYHLQHFPKLSRPENSAVFDDASDWIYSMFHGIGKLWDIHDDKLVWYEKTISCYRLLIAWYITDMYPKMLSGLPAMGGVALKRKKIGDIDITFADPKVNQIDDDDLLQSLKSNPFGGKAYMAIRTAGKRVLLRNLNSH
jgi:hypothetical protein